MKLSTVLVIDDSEADRFLARITIEAYDANIRILEAVDGAEALKILSTGETPDVIFLDINMPVMGGHAFLAHHAEHPDQTAVVVMLTSSADDRDRTRCSQHDFILDYFEKPLTKQSLESLTQSTPAISK